LPNTIVFKQGEQLIGTYTNEIVEKSLRLYDRIKQYLESEKIQLLGKIIQFMLMAKQPEALNPSNYYTVPLLLLNHDPMDILIGNDLISASNYGRLEIDETKITMNYYLSLAIYGEEIETKYLSYFEKGLLGLGNYYGLLEVDSGNKYVTIYVMSDQDSFTPYLIIEYGFEDEYGYESGSMIVFLRDKIYVIGEKDLPDIPTSSLPSIERRSGIIIDIPKKEIRIRRNAVNLLDGEYGRMAYYSLTDLDEITVRFAEFVYKYACEIYDLYLLMSA